MPESGPAPIVGGNLRKTKRAPDRVSPVAVLTCRNSLSSHLAMSNQLKERLNSESLTTRMHVLQEAALSRMRNQLLTRCLSFETLGDCHER